MNYFKGKTLKLEEISKFYSGIVFAYGASGNLFFRSKFLTESRGT